MIDMLCLIAIRPMFQQPPLSKTKPRRNYRERLEKLPSISPTTTLPS